MERDEDRLLDSDTEYVQMFNAFFSRAKMTATYKTVLLRSLLDLGRYSIQGSNSDLRGSKWIEVDGNTVVLDLNFIAARFIKYYWDMDHSFKLKQTTNPNDASIVQIVRKYRKKGKLKKPPTLDELVSDSSKQIRQETIALLKKQPLHYLKKSNMQKLYKLLPDSKIKLNTNIIPFLKQHRIIIRNSLNHKLAIKLESLNKSVPQIAAKIDEENHPSRLLHAQAKQLIDNNQQQKCFYCDKPYMIAKKRHIDHVIPFNYIFSTDVFNCVAACIKCNLRKHDSLPACEFFDAVVTRNAGFRHRLTKLPNVVKRSFADYDDVWYKKTHNACYTEYHGNAALFKP